jgi:hypothetical protein
MWQGRENYTYAFGVLEMPASAKNKSFNEEKFRADFQGVLDVRRVPDRSAGVAATVFVRTETANILDLDRIMSLDMREYVI